MNRRWFLGSLAVACLVVAASLAAPASVGVSTCTDPAISVVLERANAGAAPLGEVPKLRVRIRNHGTERLAFHWGRSVLSEWAWSVRDALFPWGEERVWRMSACNLVSGIPEQIIEPGGELVVKATLFADAPRWPALWQVHGTWEPWGVTRGGEPLEFMVKSNVVTITIGNPLWGWIGLGLMAALFGGAIWIVWRWVRSGRQEHASHHDRATQAALSARG